MTASHTILRALTVAALAAASPAQHATTPRTSPLFVAWLDEQLARDPAAVRAAYERAIRSEDEPIDRRAVACARLLEVERVLGDAQAVESLQAELNQLLGSEPTTSLTVLDLPRDELRTALAMPSGPERDRAVEAARAALSTALDALRMPPRSIVPFVVRRVTADRDQQRQNMESELAAARAAGDTERARELSERLRDARGTVRRADVDRARAWRVRVVRLLGEGRFDLAEVLRARFPAEIEPATARDGDALQRALARPDITPVERDALEGLAARIATWRETHRPDADRALALLPY